MKEISKLTKNLGFKCNIETDKENARVTDDLYDDEREYRSKKISQEMKRINIKRKWRKKTRGSQKKIHK